MDAWTPIWTTLRVGLAATLIAVPLGLVFAWLAAHWRFRFQRLVEALILLPLLIPGPVFGYCILMAFTTTGPFGFATRYGIGSPVLFSETVAVLAAVIYTAPFVALLATRAFRDIQPAYFKLVAVLGIAEWRAFWHVALPLASKPLTAIAVVALARAIGEFGILLVFAPSLAGRAATLPWALFYGIYSPGDVSKALLWFAASTTLALLLLAIAARIRGMGRML
ncbi:MAG: ABC transporter permease subunit [Bryobacterales bacterium]|nr:ABC transporter permease subunit [Bryobacterales bacterium]